MLRNIASQKYRVYAWDATTGLAKTGDAANISAHIRKDDAASAATNDTNPTEASATNEPGYYDFDLTQSETDAIKVSLVPKSATANIQVVACPPVVYTRPQYFSVLGIASDGDLTKVNTLDGHTPQTGDTYAIVNSGTHGNAALKTLIDNVDNFVDTEVAEILTRIGSPSVSITADIAALNDIAAADVWAVGTRSLTILDEDSTTLDLDATIRAAIGLSSANLDTQLTAIDDFVDTEVSTILTRIGVPAVSLSADIAAIEAQTDDIGTAGAGLTAIPWNSSWDAEVQSEVQDAIEANHLDHLLAVTYDPASKPGASDALLNELVENDGGVARFTANALEQGPSGGGGVADWTADERTAIRAILGIPGSGTTPEDPTTGILDTIRDKIDAVDDFVDTEISTILTRIGVPSVSLSADLANIDSDIAALNNFDPATEDVFLGDGAHGGTSATLRLGSASSTPALHVTNSGGDAALFASTSLSGNGIKGSGIIGICGLGVGSNSTGIAGTGGGTGSSGGHGISATGGGTSGHGMKLTRGGSGVTGGVDLELTNSDAATLANVVWNAGTRTLTALDEDTTTLDLDNTIRAALGLASANLDTQLAKLDTIDDFLDTEISTILTRIGVPATSLTASIAALNNISTAQVNAEVVDALNVDTYAEPTGVPSATASLVSKIGRLYKALMRGIEITATEKRFLDSAGSSEWKKTLSDDGTTYEETSALAP